MVGRTGRERGKHVGTLLGHTGRIFQLAVQILRTMVLAYKNPELTVKQMFVLGVETFPLVLAVSAFVGAEVVLQAVYQFAGIIPLRYLGFAVRATTLSEFAPVITSVVFSGRIATSIAAEIANMNATDQLDAMGCLRLDPVRYLLVPRVAACMLMLPALVVFSELCALLISVATVLLYVDMSLFEYLESLKRYFELKELFVGIIKTVPFGFCIGLVGSYFGLHAQRSVDGVGESTSRAVMASCALILIIDFIIALIMM